MTSVGGYPLPLIAKTGGGLIHTLYSSLTLKVDANGAGTFSYDISDLDDLDDSIDVRETCTSTVNTYAARGVLTLHWLTDSPNACPKAAIDGEQFTESGDELIYTWDNYRAVLKRKN